MGRQDEAQVRAIVQNIIDKQFAIIEKNTEKEIKKQIQDSESKIKREYVEFVKKEIAKINGKILTKKDVKDILIKAFIQQNRFMWEKSSVINQYMNKV